MAHLGRGIVFFSNVPQACPIPYGKRAVHVLVHDASDAVGAKKPGHIVILLYGVVFVC